MDLFAAPFFDGVPQVLHIPSQDLGKGSQTLFGVFPCSEGPGFALISLTSELIFERGCPAGKRIRLLEF